MDPAIGVPLSLLIGYLLGSVNLAIAVASMRGVDIRRVGSGNPGASNVLRTMGRGPAVLVFVGDALKGVVAAAVGALLTGQVPPAGPWVVAAGLAAVLGHCFPVFHRFRGGRGMATAVGVLIFVAPVAGLISAAVWGAVTALTKTASIASLATLAVSVPAAWWQGVRGAALVWWLAIVVLVVWRHRANIGRLVRHSEGKVPG